MRVNLQLDSHGRLRHFLTIEGLSRALLTQIMDVTEEFATVAKREVKKVPLLRGKVIANLFFEPSTRTRNTFELAAKRLSADVLNIHMPSSATSKGETLLDTLRNMQAMHCDMFVVRHGDSGAAHFMARHVAPHVRVVNAGDGRHAHPTQAMLDLFTIRKHKKDFSPLRVTIVGDLLHSRVARSLILALQILGTGDIRAVAPKTLLPNPPQSLGVHIFHSLEEGIQNADVIIVLRLQRERMTDIHLPSAKEYFRLYGLTEKKLEVAKENVMVMHPGPINRGIEMESRVADGPRSVILQQVSYGIATRMAVMSMCMRGAEE